MRIDQAECVHGMPGGNPGTCALCRVAQRRATRHAAWVDVRRLAAGDDA
jgi:hypothetical protein